MELERLLDIYLALSHIGPQSVAPSPLAPLPGEAPEETPRVYVAHASGPTGPTAQVWRVCLRDDLPPVARAALAALPPRALANDRAQVEAMLAASGPPCEGVWVGRTSRFPDELPSELISRVAGVVHLPAGVDGYGQPAPAEGLRPALPRLDDEAPPAPTVFPVGQFAIVEGGRVVATCESSRESLVAAEAWVRTEPAARGKGYATRVTAAWALDARWRGKIPFYSHHRDNAASAGVARALGLIPFLDDVGYL